MVKQAKEKTKLVVRKLPPALTADSFLAAINKIAEGKYNWSTYLQGKVRCGQGVRRAH